jgi:hypothetical protein
MPEDRSMHNHRFQILALALLVLCTVAALLLAGVVAMGMALSRPIALAATGLSLVLIAGGVALHRLWREARWDAGYRLR